LRKSVNDSLSSRANARDLAREWFELGGEDPSVAALSQDDTGLSDLRKAH
jgi:hypothetical protein